MIYAQLVRGIGCNPSLLAEPAQGYQFMTERHLQVMWLEQKYFKKLSSTDGLPIEVLSPGIWNSEAGPDFLKAHIKLGEQELRGDIEIHLHDESWVAHRHHEDANYDNVILHISLWIPKNHKSLQTKAGKLLNRAYLEPYLTIPLSRIVSLVDLELYPYKKFVGSGRCANSLFYTLPTAEAETLFESAAHYRLTEKYQSLKAAAEERCPFLTGFAQVLGYKHNGRAFVELFSRLHSKYRSCPDIGPNELLVFGLGMCGFFDSGFQKKWGKSSHYQSLYAKWTESTCERVPLILHHIRPLNHPVRRIALLAMMITDPSLTQLYKQMRNYWYREAPSCHSAHHWTMLRDKLISMLPTYHDAYWNSHFTFEEQAKGGTLTLLGDSVKQEVIVNVFLPLLHQEIYVDNAHAAEDKALFTRFYRIFPLIQNSKTRYLTHRFFGNTIKGEVIGSATMQQGAFQLHRDFCTQYEASCDGCPFVDRYKQTAE